MQAIRSLLSFDLSHLRGDIYDGLTTGLVAIPQALAFGVASGLGPIAGMSGDVGLIFTAVMLAGVIQIGFGAAADLGHHVRERFHDATHSIILDFRRVPFLDVSAARAVETITSDARRAGKRVYIAGMSDDVKDTLCSLGADVSIPDEAHFATRLEALQAIVDHPESTDRTPTRRRVAPAPLR